MSVEPFLYKGDFFSCASCVHAEQTALLEQNRASVLKYQQPVWAGLGRARSSIDAIVVFTAHAASSFCAAPQERVRTHTQAPAHVGIIFARDDASSPPVIKKLHD